MVLLLVQVATGVTTGVTARWGYAWFPHVATPWLASLVRLSPRVDLMANLPWPFQVHAVNAFVLLALVPYTRLAHIFVAPIEYLWRLPQVVIWRRPRPVSPGGSRSSSRVLDRWDVEDKGFWANEGRAIAQRNLWISIPALLLSFAVWMVWSVVVVRLPEVGFTFSTDQLFWLAALPGLSGATLRIFYSFMVPIFGGRKWTAISTASLLLPAVGIGFAVQDPGTSYATMLVLALLCGFGGGNFASSMANISFFFPKEQKGTALGLNAGLGNLGVSTVQFVVPLVITAGVFGPVGGPPQLTRQGRLRLAAERRASSGCPSSPSAWWRPGSG